MRPLAAPVESMQQPPTREGPEAGWLGQLELRYALQRDRLEDSAESSPSSPSESLQSQGPKTVITRDYAKAPYKLQRPFYPEGPTVCHTVMLHTAGGLVGGDRLEATIHLAPQTHALITTAAAAKVYRSCGQPAQQTIQIDLAPGASLEWFPQETIVFEQAQYRQNLRVELAEGAQWIGWDILRLGRSARGEQFLAGDVRSHIEIWRGEQPLWLDRQWIPGQASVFWGQHGLAGAPVVGSFAWVGQAVTPELVQQLRSLVPQKAVGVAGNLSGQMAAGDLTGNLAENLAGDLAQHLSDQSHPAGEFGVTRLPLGVLCRYRGHSSSIARQWFCQIWQRLRLQALQRPACLPRVWG